MSYDYSKLFDLVLDATRSDASPQERMQAVIEGCEAQRPHGDWESFRRIDYNQELQAVDGWLRQALSEAGGPERYKGLWFGLSNPVRNGTPTADIYVAASAEYGDGEIEWAVNSTFYANSREFHSRILGQLYRIAYANQEGLGNDAEYPLVLAYGAIIARRALEGQVFGGAFSSLAGAAVGFDDGDFLFLGHFENGQFILDVQAG